MKRIHTSKLMKLDYKKNIFSIAAICISCLITPVMVNAQEGQTDESTEPESVTWKTYWDHGFKFKSSDNRFSFKFGGRIMNDWVAPVSYDDNLKTALGDPTNGTEFRRVRFFNSGTIYDNITYKLQFDFTGGDADLKDAYIRINKIPAIGHLKIGHYKEPFGLEELTSSKYITFMARALTSPFQPSRNAGVTIHNEILDGRMTYALGTFRDVDGYGSSKPGETARYNLTGRITGLPWEQSNNLVHLGLAYQMRNPDKKEVRYSSEPETHQQPDFVNTGTIDNVSGENIAGVELAAVYGPFSVQSEFQTSTLNREDGSPGFSAYAYYAYASVFLTEGDHRAYGGGSFSRVKPQKNFGEDGGLGALELAVRYSDLDLTDEEIITGGQLSDITAGLNWYLNPSTRVMFNYVLADVKDGRNNANGKAGFFRTRFQINF